MTAPARLQSTEPQRLRQVELERRIFPILKLIAVVLWVALPLLALSYPLRGVLITGTLGLTYTAVMFAVQRRAVRSSAPLAWLTIQEFGVVGLLVYVVTWTGGVDSPALPMTIVIAMVIGMRFPLRWGAAQIAVSAAALLAAMWFSDAEALRSAPFAALSWLFAFGLAAIVTNMLARAERGARKDALHDALTGLLNRKALQSRLEEAQGHLTRRTETVSVIAVDLDGFKAVNDRFGHEAGDDVLRKVAASLAGSVREGDLLYRIGGDEFLVILMATPTGEATELAERLRGAVTRLRPGGHDVTLSLGVAGVAHAHVDLESLISDADRALYSAKAAGRDRVGVADPASPSMPAAP